jgi:RNA polymerase sigma-70 factor (ECF subfamily)
MQNANWNMEYVSFADRCSQRDYQGMEELCSSLSRSIRRIVLHLVRAQWADDVVQEVLLIVIETIRSGNLRDPECLMGFVRKVAQRRAAAHLREVIFARRKCVPVEIPEPCAPPSDSPDTAMNRREREERARKALRRLSARDREILDRFYVQGQARGKICTEMRLTDTQFRLFKSRAIARCLDFERSAAVRISPQARSVWRTA